MIVVTQMPQQSAVQTQFSRWLFFNEKNVPISNFIPSVISVVKVISSSGTREDIRVRLHFENEKITETIVPLSDLDSVNWFDIDHHCIVNSEYRQSRKYIADTIRSAIGTAPLEQRYSLDRTGIYRIEDTIVFAAGDRIITQSNVSEADSVFELGQLPFRLDIDENIDLNTAIEGIVQLVSLSPEIGHILIAHVISGIIRAAFKEAGMTPCAVLVIVGKSGMLKSHYIPHLVQLYNRGDGIGPVTRFNSTKRFIEDALYEYSECTAIIDDLHTAESSAIKRQNEDTAEEIIRRISDDRGRGHMKGKELVQRHFRGNAVFIGEYTIGKASTIPRALIVEITKPPNGAILDEYQRKKSLLASTFYYYFIQWYVDHFDAIRDAIDVRLTQLRKTTTSSTTHGRLRDTQFYLEISYMVFLEFCKDSDFCSEEEAIGTYHSFRTQLYTLVQAQEARLRESLKAQEKDYLSTIRDLYNEDCFRLAKNEKNFNPEKHDGLIYYGCLCLRGKRLEGKLRNVCSGFSLADCINGLLTKDALKVVGNKNTVQINGTGGKRFYAIKLDKLK